MCYKYATISVSLGRDMQNLSKQSVGLISRNITVLGKRTSIRLERQMWNSLHDIAQREKCSVHDICSLVAQLKHNNLSLTASIRIFLMAYYKAAATEEGHEKAGHGNFLKMMGRANKMVPPAKPVNQNDVADEERTTKTLKKEPYYG